MPKSEFFETGVGLDYIIPMTTPPPEKSFPDSPWSPGSRLLEQFSVEDFLGKGGMGTVYLVHRAPDNTPFAVKTLLKSHLREPGKYRQFLREIRIWIDLPDHPHLTSCRFVKSIDDHLAIFAEYVNGGSLKDWIAGGKITSPKPALDIALQIAWGLEAAHAQGIVHQDIKPANILITDDGIAKITDFGLSRALDMRDAAGESSEKPASPFISSSGMTAAYCSPEQSRKSPLNHKTDIWSYGLTVLEMFTGPAKWFLGVLAPNVLEGYLKKAPYPPYPMMPDGLAQVLFRCFENRPQDRWESMSDLSSALQEVFLRAFGKLTRDGNLMCPQLPHKPWPRSVAR